MKKIILLMCLFCGMALLFPNKKVYAEQIKEVIITNFPSIVATKEEPKSTKVIGSQFVYIRSEDLMDIPPLYDNTITVAKYEGQGKLTYLVFRGSTSAIGARIIVDGNIVAEATGNTVDVLGSGASMGWKLLRPISKDVVEVNVPYSFSESLEIQLYNHSFETIKGGVHAELEI